MYATIATPGMATSAFVEQFTGYVERWVSRRQSQTASAPADPKGPGRPCETRCGFVEQGVVVCLASCAWGTRRVACVGVPGLRHL